MNGAARNTEIAYLCRDTSTWKFWGTLIVRGSLSRSDLKQYLVKFPWLPSDIELFNPTALGLEHLLTEPRNSEVHHMHELHEFVPTNREDALCSAGELVARFAAASDSGWKSGDNRPWH